MKRLITIILASMCLQLFAQNSGIKADDFGRIVLSSYLDGSKTAVPVSAFNILKNKLSQIVTQNGIGSSIPQRFIITANVDVLSEDITSTVPPMYALNLTATFYVGDGVEGTLFSSRSLPLKGVGDTREKAIIAALKKIMPTSPEFIKLIEVGKARIVEYYNANGDMYIKKAKALAEKERYDDAIYMLLNIPEVCRDVYDKAMDEVAVIYRSKIDKESAKILAEANAVWSAGLDYDAAETASKLLSKVHPDSKSYSSAVSLSETIAKRMKELDKREWSYKLQEQKNEHESQMAQVKAYKEIAIAQAEHQPSIQYRLVWW